MLMATTDRTEGIVLWAISCVAGTRLSFKQNPQPIARHTAANSIAAISNH